MPNPVKGLLEVYGNIAVVLLVLEIFLSKDSHVEDLLMVLLLALKPAFS